MCLLMKSVSCSMYIFVFFEYSNSIEASPGMRVCGLNRHHPAARRNGLQDRIEHGLSPHAVLEGRRRALALARGGKEALHERPDRRLPRYLEGVPLARTPGQARRHFHGREAAPLGRRTQLTPPPARFLAIETILERSCRPVDLEGLLGGTASGAARE